MRRLEHHLGALPAAEALPRAAAACLAAACSRLDPARVLEALCMVDANALAVVPPLYSRRACAALDKCMSVSSVCACSSWFHSRQQVAPPVVLADMQIFVQYACRSAIARLHRISTRSPSVSLCISASSSVLHPAVF